MTAAEKSKRAAQHAEAAEKLLVSVDTRKDEGPMYGAVKAESAHAHALLALFFQREAHFNYRLDKGVGA